MKHHRSVKVTVALLSLLLCALPLFAGTTGKIAGKVTDKETGFPLPSVNVILVGTTLGAATNQNGEYFVLNVPPGAYDVKASIIGYTQVVEKGTRVFADLTTQVDFALPTETLELGEVVEVIAERPLIQKDVTSSSKITTDEQIDALPVSNVNDAISLSASTQGSGNNLHLRGGRGGEVAYQLDGLTIEDPQTRDIGLRVGRSALAELQIISGGFNAEYGNAQSGVILLNTQEGKRDYSGKVFYQTDHAGEDGLGESVEKFDWYEASLGGPEPITTYLLPKIGVQVPGYMTLFLQGETRMNDGIGFHEEALREARDPVFLTTSNRLANESLFHKVLGIGDNRQSVQNSWDTKLVWQMAPNRKLTCGFRGNHDDTTPWTFLTSLNLNDAVQQAHAMGISDRVDNDADGRTDEETFDSRDNDGDGRIDEDAVLDTRYDFAWSLDNDGDGRVDEEAVNGIDDDGDGRVDEDAQPYNWNGYDHWRRNETRANQLALTWTHTLSPKTFYELRLGRFSTSFGTIPKIGKDGVSASSFDEVFDWVNQYEAAIAEIDRRRAAGEPVPRIEDLVEPYRGFGNPSEPYVDGNANSQFDAGETFTDWDGDGLWDRNFGNRTNPVWFFSGENHPFRGQNFNGNYWVDDRAGFSRRTSVTYSLKLDLTSQATNNHQIKSGFEANYFDLENISRQLLNPFDGRGLFGNDFHVFPNWQAVYLQDKMEFSNAIVNLGLRMERFDQGEQVAELDTSVGVARFDRPEAKYSFLPRIGFSFPVTERDQFFFNYGRFFQRPELSNVYTQVNQVFGSSNSIIGNPNLDPEETIQYEFGIRHQFGLNTLFTITGYFKDIENLLQINQEFDVAGNTFRTYFNDTYGTVKGLELQLQQRAGQYFSGEGVYTFQVAKATHSTARRTYTNENIFAALPGTEYFADWDQRHRFVVNLDYHYGKDGGPTFLGIRPLENWNINLLADLASGMPYTPQSANGTDQFERTNTKRLPWTYTLNLRMRRFFDVSGLRLGAVFEVQNLLNRRNVVSPDNSLTADPVIDQYRDRIGYTNEGTPSGTRNFGGYANSVVIPTAWEDGRKIRIGFWTEF